jgi:alkaline phosphatase
MNCFSRNATRRPARRSRLSALCWSVALCTVATCAAARDENPGQWFADGNAELQKALQMKANEGHAKNVILFVGDGMSLTTVTAARIFDGQARGETGEENSLAFEELPYMALAKTYNTDQQVPDSAGTVTAMMSGVKTKAGVIGVNQNVQRGDCKSAQGNSVQSILEFAAKAGLATGIVTTSSVTDATPAGAYAHVPERGWQSDHDMPTPSKIAGCRDIARQLVEFQLGGGIDVVLGGGRGKFLPSTVADPEGGGATGERDDRRDLTAEWAKKAKNGAYVWNQQQFTAIDPKKVDRLLGLFNRAEMSFEADRKADVGGEPSLPEMTKKAVAILKKNPKGFFLLVEGGRIDHAHHMGNAYRALDETREFSNAVRAALAATDLKDTLVIVTADHGHVLTMGGYAKRGNPILGKVSGNDDSGKSNDGPQAALDGKPYTTLGYMNGPGAIAVRNAASAERERRDLSDVDTTKPDYLQQALVPLSKETHSGEDVPVYAGGPWAQLFHRTVEQNYIFHVMRHALSVPDKTPAPKAKPKARPAPAPEQ